jgi:hypothetical protein
MKLAEENPMNDDESSPLDPGLVDEMVAFGRRVGLPAGSVVLYGGDDAPVGWLWCNGNIIGREEFPRLFMAIGTKFDEDVNDRQFRVPKLDNPSPELRYMIKA